MKLVTMMSFSLLFPDKSGRVIVDISLLSYIHTYIHKNKQKIIQNEMERLMHTKFVNTYSVWIFRYIYRFRPIQEDSYIHRYIHRYIHTYIHTNIYTYIDTYIHTYIQTYIHIYIHTYIHIHT